MVGARRRPGLRGVWASGLRCRPRLSRSARAASLFPRSLVGALRNWNADLGAVIASPVVLLSRQASLEPTRKVPGVHVVHRGHTRAWALQAITRVEEAMPPSERSSVEVLADDLFCARRSTASRVDPARHRSFRVRGEMPLKDSLGLRIRAERDTKGYRVGVKLTDEQLAAAVPLNCTTSTATGTTPSSRQWQRHDNMLRVGCFAGIGLDPIPVGNTANANC